MKRMLMGGFLLIGGILLYVGTAIAAAVYASNMTFREPSDGRFKAALRETGGAWAHGLAIGLAVIGLAILVYESRFFIGIIRRYSDVVKERSAEFDRKYK
ncbi:hypothetical protein I8J29_03405 [Paenibacillus sp. MWE-103]|uniref:Uncharacterized protein n=1 Tax=Paenibacillus artemisiicola TaxID=1172618 RepID=A0ABS3W4I9_9BACL|nr:hypothetical protein [Paenibacillus artemisiicola]MBO7743227.1 hypothetical protein [Paenibacillus artemisiicola]